jgi:4-hydroxy-3-methylbut-2-en-1-yl diphosphate synthase IspG/GcpE
MIYGFYDYCHFAGQRRAFLAFAVFLYADLANRASPLALGFIGCVVNGFGDSQNSHSNCPAAYGRLR